MDEIKKIQIFAKERKNSEGNSFMTYRAKLKNGGTIVCKFTMDSEFQCPDNLHTFNLLVQNDAECANISNSTGYPILWIRKFEGIEEIPTDVNPLADF